MNQLKVGAGRYVAAIAALLFAVLYVAGLSFVVGLPGVDKSGEAVVSFLRDHAGAVRLQGLFVAWGALALVIILAYARDRLQRAFAHVFTIGAGGGGTPVRRVA